MGEWNFVCIKDLFSYFIDGDWIEAPYLSHNGIRFIQTGNIGDSKYEDKPEHKKYISESTFRELKCKKVYPGDLLICRLAEPVGRATFCPKEQEYYVTSVDVVIARPKDQYVINYVFYMLNWKRTQKELNEFATGTTRKRISRTKLGEIKIQIPDSKKEQSKIAEILTTVDNVIEKTRALIEKYKNIKTGLMQNLLTNGIDRHGNIRSPETHEYKPSPLGMIPVDWDCVTIGEVTSKIGSGATPRGGQSVYTNEGVIFLRSQNITFDGIALDDVAYITNLIHHQMQRSHVEKYDVLLNITGASIGRCCIYESDDVANVNQHVCIIRTIFEFQSAQLLYRWLCSFGQTQINLLMAGGNREGLNFEQIKSICLPLIKNSEELVAINAILNKQDKKIQSEQAYLNKLLYVKQGLMQDLLTHTVPVDALL